MPWILSNPRGTVDSMANKADHMAWTEDNFALAEQLWESDNPVERRWSAVVAYCAILHTAHAVAADLWSDHPEGHFAVREVVTRMDPNRLGLGASVQEASLISINARYIGDHEAAATWFAPSFMVKVHLESTMSSMSNTGSGLESVMLNAPATLRAC